VPSPDHVPLFVIITHALNILFLLMLARSGIEVLSSSPSCTGTTGARRGGKWARLMDAVPSPPREHGSVYTSVGWSQPRMLPQEAELTRAAQALNESEKVAMRNRCR
jgi:hypothetical protein